MAIIIPSANIYEMQNDKILDNQISGVEGKINAFDNQNKLEHKETINLDYLDITNNFSQNTNYKQITFGNRPFYANPNITVYYVKFYYDFSIKEDIFLLNNLTVKTENLYSSNNADYERDIWQIYNPNYSGDISFAIVNNETEFDNLEEANWGKVGLQRLNTNLFRLYLKVVYLGVVNTAFSSFNIGDIVAKSKERTISFYAYKQIEKTVIYGLSNNVDSLNKNELIQETTKNGTTKISEYLANNILYSYKNGKETATIRCSINDYKNEDGTIAKSITDTTKDMTFRMYDNVIPMIPSPNGDVPMSKYKDGTSKIFKVLGTKLINNGACWQELTLQERLREREKYIKFEIDGDGTNTISARANSTSGTTTGISSNRTMQYSLNGKDWNSWNGSALTITTSQPIYLRSNITANGGAALYTNFFFGNSTTKIKCSGDMRYMAMTNNYAEISNTVPFTDCYRSMFQSCTSLTTAPSLPATTLADNCYSFMFHSCTLLTTAPSLPATTLADYCYRYMFYGCTSLTTAPSLPATTLATDCYRSMFFNCTSLTTAPNLPATTLASSCYAYMFRNCTSLTTAPSLPATTLANYCYYSMFSDCTSLTQVSININNNTTIPTAALSSMLASTGTVSQPPNAIYCDRTTIIADTNATSRWIRQPYAE